jgi:glycosyltransferase involved in cell wall biosynthesis
VTEFTIVLPTTADRAATLDPVLRHAQLQSVSDWEMFIIGDGVNDATRATIQRWCRDDPRMRFFDHPKDARRGEVYRHRALAEARGRNVAYLCDRDLWLYDHLATLAGALDGFDFAHTQRFSIDPAGSYTYQVDVQLERVLQRSGFRRRALPVGMSTVGHSLASYRRLPFGWRTTPAGVKTDRYMWRQFLADGQCTGRSAPWPTVLYFNRGDHPGWPSAARGEELERWNRRLPDVEAQAHFREEAMRELARPGNRARQAWRSWLYWHPKAQRAYQRIRGSIG